MEYNGKKVYWVEHAIASKKLDHMRIVKVVNEKKREKEVIALCKSVAHKSLSWSSLNLKSNPNVVLLGVAKSMTIDVVKVEDEKGLCKLCGLSSKARGGQSNLIIPRKSMKMIKGGGTILFP